MKKFLSIMALAAIMTACNTGEDANDDADSLKNTIDSTADAQKDKIDSLADDKKDKVDSLSDRKDSLDKK